MTNVVSNTVSLYNGSTFIQSYSTIQEAVDAASPFDTIQIGGGTYKENVNVTVNGLTIENVAGQQVTIDGVGGYAGAIGIASGVYGVTIKSSDGVPANFVVEGDPTYQIAALYLVGGNTDIKINGITTIAGGPDSISNSVLTGGIGGGISNVLFENNVFQGNAAQLVYVGGTEDFGPSGQDGNVNFVGNTFSGTSASPGAALLSMNAPGEVINNTFSGSAALAVGLGESGVNVSGNTFSPLTPTPAPLPTTAYFAGDGSYDPKTIEQNNTFPQQDEVYIIQNGVRQDGVYSSIQAAIDAAINGDTIVAGPGTYNESLNIDKGVTILGANANTSGTGTRGAETIITGQSQITTTNQVTINGVEFLDNQAYTLSDTDNFDSLLIAGDSTAGDVIENSIFDRAPTSNPPGFDANGFATSGDQPTHRGIELENVGAGTQVTIENNLFTGTNQDTYAGNDWRSAIYSNGGDGTTTITDNTFENVRAGVNADNFSSATVQIAGNTFDHDGTGVAVGVGSDVANVTSITGNTFGVAVDNEFNFKNLTTSVGFDAGAKNDVLSATAAATTGEYFYIEGGSGDDTLTGTSANDILLGDNGNNTLTGGGGNDLLYGGTGVTTADYVAALTPADITPVADADPLTPGNQAGWQVNAGAAEGTDSLNGVQVVQGASSMSSDGRFLLVGNGGFATIQDAINAANAGDTILIAPGTYTENVTVNVANLTIESDGGTVTLQGTFKSDNGIANGGVMAFLESGAPYSQAAGRGFDIEANGVTLKNLNIDGFAYGVNLGNGSSVIDGATLNNVAITDSLIGVHKGTTSAITNLAIDGGSMSDGLIGVDFDIDTTPANYNTYTANGVTIDGTDFNNYAYKGIYAETLSNADITGVTMENVGQYGAPSTSGPAGTSGDGIDLNLKNGSYSGITIENFTLNNVGASNENGSATTGDVHGGAIVVEARDSGSYANAKGTLTDPVVIKNGTIEGSTSTGIQVGEPGQSNLDGPNVNISNVSISGAEHDAGHGDIANVTAGTTTMTLQATGQTVDTSPTSTGNIVFNSSPQADTITGHGETDTVNYTETLNVADFSYNSGNNQWTVNAGGTDVDTLSGVEAVQGADPDGAGPLTGKYLLVDPQGSYTSIQAAINAANAGDTVVIAAGTYNGNVALKNGVNVVGQSQANVIVNGTISTPADFDNTTVSNMTVNGTSLLDMTGTSEVDDSAFQNITFNLTGPYNGGNVPIGNGQVSGSIAINDSSSAGAGLTFSNVTMNSGNNAISSPTQALVYTLFHTSGDAQLVLNGVSLNGTASGSSTGLGAQWNMSPNAGESAAVTIENSSTSGGGNFYVSGMSSATITNNTFDGQGLALNGVTDGSVTGNTFENIDGSITSNGTQHRGLTIENAWGATGDSDITVENNIFHNITASDGAIAFQRWTDNNGNLIPATISQLNDIDIQGNTFTGVTNSVYLNPDSFNSSTVIPASFNGQQLIIGTSGADTINDTSTGPMTIIGGGGGDTISGGSGNTTYYVSPGDTLTDSGGIDEVRTGTAGTFTLPANIENLTLLDGDSNTQTFDNMPLGAITNGEDGWEVLTPGEDESVVAGPDGSNEFKMSSDPGNTAFGGPYSPGLSVAAGEPDTGALFSGETISYDFQAVSATPDGSRLEVDFGNAAGTDRNNFLVIESAPTGIRIAVSEPDLSGNFSGDNTDPSPDDWRQLISGVDPSVQHTLTMQLAYVDGQNNDVINIYLDGQLIGTTTTFENYHDSLGGTHDANAAANLTDRIFFRPSANGAPQDGPGGQNQGFYFDNITNSVYNNSNGTGNSLDNVITGNDGNNILTGGGGNDTLIGGGGFDTANYLGTLTASDISYDSVNADWTVNATNDGQSEGTDTLSQMEIVTDGAGHTFRLVGGSSQYQTIQEAIDASSAGDTIIVAPGTYNEHLSVDKSITIEGANAGTAGTGTRVAETNIVGGITITADNVTIDGVEVTGSYNSVAQDGTDLPNGVVIKSNNVAIENSVFTGDGAAVDSRPFSTFGGITGFSFSNNAVTGWQEGAYIVNGGAGTISDDTFTNDGNGVVTESVNMTISSDSFQHSGTPPYTIGSDIATDGNQSSIDLSNFIGPSDTFSVGDTTQLSVYLNAGGPVSLTNDTGINATIHGEYATGPLAYFGGTANDTITGTSLNDTFTVGTGNDSIDGGSGIDTVKYDAALTAADLTVANNQWQVSDGTHGTDTLNNVEEVTDGTHNFLLIGAGGFASVETAVNAAQAGDTIVVAPGTYALTLTVTSTDVGTSGEGSVPFTLTGLKTNDQGTVTFTDSTGHAVLVAVNGGQTNYTANISSLHDGTITSSFNFNTGAAVTTFAPVAGTTITLDTVQPTLSTPSIVGTAQEGQTLTAASNVGQSDDTLSFAWYSSADRFATPIGTGSTYLVKQADEGHTIEVIATATNPNGSTTSTSAPTATVIEAFPTVTPTNSTTNASPSQTFAASSLFSASDPDGTPILSYEVKDTSPNDATHGFWSLNGVVQANGSQFTVTASQLSGLKFTAGSNTTPVTDTLEVAAADAAGLGSSATFTVNASANANAAQAPTVTAPNETVLPETNLTASSMFSGTAFGGNSVVSYEVEDTTSNSGSWVLNGVTEPANQVIDVTAANLSQLSFQTGFGTDTLMVRANDGTQWGNFTTFTVSPKANAAPPAGTTTVMDLEETGTGILEYYDIGNSGVLQAGPLDQISTSLGVVGIGGFNGSDTADLMTRDTTTGAFTLFDVSSNNVTGNAALGQVGLEWQVAGFGDFSGTAGETDMLLRDTNNGNFEVYDIRNNAITNAAALGQVGLEWQVAGFGDFSTKAGETDMLMRNSSTGQFEVYDIRGNQVVGAASMGQVGTEWQVFGFGDFSGNANETDMLMQNTNTGAFELYDISNNSIAGASGMGQVGLDWTVAGFADFSGNANETDMLLRNSASGDFELYDISKNAITSATSIGNVGLNWQVSGVAVDPPPSSSGGAASTVLSGLSSDPANPSISQLTQAMASMAQSGGTATATTPIGQPQISAANVFAATTQNNPHV